MTKIFSKINPDKLLHMIVRKEDIKEGRTNLCPDDEFIQCAALKLPKGTTFKPHQHNLFSDNKVRIPQESWFVHTGLVLAVFYDTDGTLLQFETLSAGEASFTYAGGHTYQILTDETFVMEYKTGPYINQAQDKTFI